jgi:hypothetical protein
MRIVTAKLVAFFFLAVSAALLAETCTAEPSPVEPRWTAQNADATIEAALAALEEIEGKPVDELVSLAKASIAAGRNERARSLLVKAISVLDLPNGSASDSAKRTLIGSLVRIGDVAEAKALANVEAPPVVKITLLGGLGEALAEAGDSAGALKAVTQIKPLGTNTGSPPPGAQKTLEFYERAARESQAEYAITGIAVALASSGAGKEALEAIGWLPNGGWERLPALNKVAQRLCRGSKMSGEAVAAGRELSRRASTEARLAISGLDHSEPETAWKRTAFKFAAWAASAIALCDGPAQAVAFAKLEAAPDTVDSVLNQVADDLSRERAFDLARAIAPAPDPADAKALLHAAFRSLRQGDTDAARKMALDAWRITPTYSPKELHAESEIDRILELLMRTGDWDAVLAAIIQPLGEIAQRGYYRRLLLAEIQERDAAAIARTLPRAIAVLKGPGPGGHAFPVVIALARAGFREEAETFFRELPQVPFSSAPAKNAISTMEVALFRAEMGDLSGALEAADSAGPMVMEVSADQVGHGPAVQFDFPDGPLFKDEFAARDKARAAPPPLVPGPKAKVLQAVASAMAKRGNLEAAWQAEALLEVEPRDTLAGRRDLALASIAECQIKTGDLRGALSTVLKITFARIKLGRLLELAALPPDH